MTKSAAAAEKAGVVSSSAGHQRERLQALLGKKRGSSKEDLDPGLRPWTWPETLELDSSDYRISRPHGATGLSAEDRSPERTWLSGGGREQARPGPSASRGERSPVYASPLSRTMETAGLAAPHRLEVLRATDCGRLARAMGGSETRAKAESSFGGVRPLGDDPFSSAPTGGESGLAVTARALPELLRIVEAHKDRHALLVSHKATIRLLVSTLLGLDPRAYRDRLDQSPASLNILDFRDASHARLSLFNDIRITPRDLRHPEMPHGPSEMGGQAAPKMSGGANERAEGTAGTTTRQRGGT